MSSSALNLGILQAKIGNVQNQADTSAVYSNGVWSFKNSTALTSVTITDAGAVTLGPSGFTGNHVVNGNVGIGTSSKITGLESFTQFTVSGQNGGIAINSTNTAAGDYSRLCFTKQGATGNEGVIRYNTNDYHMGFFTNATERMRLDASGNLLVGTTNSSVSAGTGFKVIGASNCYIGVVTDQSSNSNAGIHLFSTSAGAYRFYVGNGGTIFATSTSITAISDASLKENIRDLETGLSQVLALKPRRFDWKEETQIDQKGVAGFIAQEVEEVLPELVYEYKYNETETKKSLKMGDMLPTLVKAIQELSAKNEALEARLAALESKP